MMAASTEVEFELPALQHALMGHPNIRQGHALSLILDAGVLLPEPAADSWFSVQQEAVPARFVRVGPALYAFSGQIREAELIREEGEESAVVVVECGDVPLRATCAPRADGRLPFGTWETRYLTGLSRIQGVIEEEFTTSLGPTIGVTVWSVRRLVLGPGDPLFGEWRETAELPPTPYTYDRVFIQARLHRQGL